MRATLCIGGDILTMAKHLAQREGRGIGEVLPDLARQALRRDVTGSPSARNGVRLLTVHAAPSPVTMEQVSQLHGELAWVVPNLL